MKIRRMMTMTVIGDDDVILNRILILQLQNFKEQMAQLQTELAGGLVQLEEANSNAESAGKTGQDRNF